MTSDMIIRFFENYGWIMTVLATSGIFFVGVLKSLGLFSRLKITWKKYIFFICSCVVSIVTCTIYLCVTDSFDWADWAVTAACVIGYTVTIYGIYENTGVRTLISKIILKPIKNFLKGLSSMVVSNSLSKDKVASLAKDLGSDLLKQLTEEARVAEDNKKVEEIKMAEEAKLLSETKVAEKENKLNKRKNKKEKIVKKQILSADIVNENVPIEQPIQSLQNKHFFS